jgi:acetylornithine deacetylase/succinyl-diaminopimelate desuccinylase-like protein
VIFTDSKGRLKRGMCAAHLLKGIESEIVRLLSDLIQIDTTNPPGNETEAAEYLVRDLTEEGFTCELFESAPGRGSVITRLNGSGGKSSLLLLSHLDVVAANPSEWRVDPFGGVVKDGFVWGRGALDMKSMTAIEVMVMKLLKRRHVKPKGDVILAAVADEEKGGEAGAGWLARNHPALVRADYVINEGGGLAAPIEGKNLYTIQTAEKGILWLRIKAKGTPGHGSILGIADNAILRMNRVVERLGNFRSAIEIVPTVKDYVSEVAKRSRVARKDLMSLLEKPESGDRFLDRLARKDRFLAENVRARVRMTVAPTVIRGGVKENIIPSDCEAVFDCRILPTHSPIEALAAIKGLLKDVGLEMLEFETIQASEPSESSSKTPLYGLIADVLKEFEPGCSVGPEMSTGGTDSRFFRKMGSVCYGFQPVRSDLAYGEMLRMIHGVDERISVENLVFGTSVLYRVVERLVG